MKECQDGAGGRLEIQKPWFIHNVHVRHCPTTALQPRRHQMLARAAVGCKRWFGGRPIHVSGRDSKWRAPDPLAPVRYVEGAFVLAAEASPFALLAALIFAALPVTAFVWVARVTGSSGTCAVAVYYASLFALAPLQATPVPLLGFGAGPILGYCLVASAVSRTSAIRAA